ncbi:unnamed protein product [Oreochromis niloticus]|nr:unnamed protein product [Mustela putorius furo]
MCDIERMFHQFHVKAEDQDYLRFLWWDDGNFQAQSSVYRIETTIQFIERNFYVDDGLTSVATKEEAIKLVKEARQLCSAGKLRIHKFISNNHEVLASIPESERADSVRNRDLDLGESQIERALGIKWCIVSDQFHFRVIVEERPLSRRGVLSTVASIYDPLGFVAPFVLVGKQILQQMCQDKVGWDEPLSEELKPRWESWLLNDPTGPQPLTPNYILTMKSSVVLPPPGEFVKEDLYLRKRWRKVQYLANEFWTRWKREYLLNLQQRGKWCKTQRNAKINDIVMLMDNSLPRNEWKLAKVTKVYPSEDGIIRKLELLISDATLDDQGKRVNKPVYLERPIHKTVTLLEAE